MQVGTDTVVSEALMDEEIFLVQQDESSKAQYGIQYWKISTILQDQDQSAMALHVLRDLGGY